jgi:large repetitive protein
VRTLLLLTLLVLTLTLGQLHPAAAVIGPVADVSVRTSASPQTVQPGSTFDITMRLENAGPFDANNVALRIAVPDNTTFVSWTNASPSGGDVSVATPAPGGTGTISACIATLETPASPASDKTFTFVLTVAVDPGVPNGQTIISTATVPGVRTADPLWCPTTTYDPAPENNTATATVSVSRPADIMVIAEAAQAVIPGSTFDIGVTLRNLGPFGAANIALRIAVPENTTFVSWTDRSCCGPPRSPAGASTPAPGGTGTVITCIAGIGRDTPPHRGDIRLVLSVRVDPNVPQGQTTTTTATVFGDRTDPLWCPPATYDPVPENNTATLTVTANGPADVAVSASATPDPVTAGGDLTYTVDVTNAGPYDAQNVSFWGFFYEATLVSFSQVSGPPSTLNAHPYGATGCDCQVAASIAGLAAGETARFTLVVNVPTTAPDGSTLHGSFGVSSGTGDPDHSNEDFTMYTRVVAGP